MKVPEDFLKTLAKSKRAKAFFEKLDKVNRFSICYRLQTAKNAEMRDNRMKSIIEMLKRGEKFHDVPVSAKAARVSRARGRPRKYPRSSAPKP
jgi:uncharacterized protein YdeI (YjbR/CyaY-like superfamily)